MQLDYVPGEGVKKQTILTVWYRLGGINDILPVRRSTSSGSREQKHENSKTQNPQPRELANS
jgi:hypothetical protein